MKKLLIYIPSYNRADSLLMQLNSICSNTKRSYFDVVVSDNCSTDGGGYKKVEDLCKRENFIYKKLMANIGGDFNITNGFFYSEKFEYLWILSDDDILEDNAVDCIIGVLNSNNLDFLFINSDKDSDFDLKEISRSKFSLSDLYEKGFCRVISQIIYRQEYIYPLLVKLISLAVIII